MSSSKQKRGVKRIRGKGNNVFNNILGPRKNVNEWRERSNKGLRIQNEKLSGTMRKRRIKFYGRLVRIKPKQLTKRIFDNFNKNRKQVRWFTEVKQRSYTKKDDIFN